jgi:hypothetical protein
VSFGRRRGTVARKKSLDEGRVPREEILQRASLLFHLVADMAADTAGLIDHLGLGPCDIIGCWPPTRSTILAEFLD